MSLFDGALDELRAALAKVDEAEIDHACKMLAAARRIGVHGCGREGLQMKGFAMRLFHLGLPVAVVGDMTMPALGAGDVFFASSGPGETGTVLTLLRTARAAGAANLVITAQTMADDQGARRTSVLPMGSLFEGAMFLLFEIMVLRIKDLLAVDDDAMRARHTNME